LQTGDQAWICEKSDALNESLVLAFDRRKETKKPQPITVKGASTKPDGTIGMEEEGNRNEKLQHSETGGNGEQGADWANEAGTANPHCFLWGPKGEDQREEDPNPIGEKKKMCCRGWGVSGKKSCKVSTGDGAYKLGQERSVAVT